jgi:hypothetical protein
MRKSALCILVAGLLVYVHAAEATVFGTVRGIVHDPQHRPVAGVSVVLKSATSDWSQATQTNDDGEFSFPTVPFGDYSVTVTASGFSALRQAFTLASDTSSVLHFMLSVAPISQTAEVKSDVGTSALETFTPTTLVDRQEIEHIPGGDLTNSLAMVTDFTPAAYMTHDMLHMRGGTSPPASRRVSTRATSTTWRSSAAATARNTATAPTGCSTSSRNRAST